MFPSHETIYPSRDTSRQYMIALNDFIVFQISYACSCWPCNMEGRNVVVVSNFGFSGGVQSRYRIRNFFLAILIFEI